ncbi:probable tRNA (uracil-O(2)-)-methyltransferase [Hemicordylus capensis]|uniref:probable tRNA (uracil-O(2)-)-methyltransferase n=1 Tax=Hemicordylus capensis TaxID=884348 RepID=UPI002302C6E4|nr:probable tRNA (uracil-O(2)-)-methyltransferase [Hemicordylus capensis]
MELLGEVPLGDPLPLPGGFWAAVSVWLEKPQVANKRLCGARLDETRKVARSGLRVAGNGDPGRATVKPLSDARLPLGEAAWEALYSLFQDCEAPRLCLAEGPAEEELEVVLRTLVPKGSPPAPAQEIVVKDIVNGTVTFLPLEQTYEGTYKVKKCNVYQIQLLHTKDNEWSVSILSASPENYISDGILYPKPVWLGSELLSKLAKWSTEVTKREFKNTLSLISVARYSKIYQDLKEKYKEIVKIWPEVTDPEKFVYEDVAIAAYLLILWEDERTERGFSRKQSFVDLGCGNGLLVHVLSNEGHPGKGIDIRRRKIWDMYGSQTCLEENTVSPNSLYPDIDWLIGNHSDELTPWIPVIAARSSYSCRYLVLPCCFFDFHGKYNRRQSKKTQYREYLDFVTEVGLVCGFNVEEDCLRIPSTKRVCLIGKSRTFQTTQETVLDKQRVQYINSRRSCNIMAPDIMDGVHHSGSPSAANSATSLIADTEVLQKTNGERVLISGFLPRGKEQVRNCTALPHDLVDQVVLKVANLLLSETQVSSCGNANTWSRGGSLALSEIAEHLDNDILKRLKNEYGGLQTLLRNNHQVFEVLNGRVHICDWREGKPSRKNKSGKHIKHRLSPKVLKTRLCWFHIHHPQGCPLSSVSCPFAHGTEELQPSQTVRKKNHAWQKGVNCLDGFLINFKDGYEED